MRQENNKKILLIVGIVSLCLIIGGISYAFFVSNTETKEVDATISTGVAKVRFADNDNGIQGTLKFGESLTKAFIIENTGTLDTTLRLYWKDLVNTYIQGSLTYELFYSEIEDGERIKIIDKRDVPVTNGASVKALLADNIEVPVSSIRYYYLVITLNNLPSVDQTPDLNATFNTKFGAQDINGGQPTIKNIDLKANTIEQLVTLERVELEDDTLIAEYYMSINDGDFKKISIKDVVPADFCEEELITAKNMKISLYTVSIDGKRSETFDLRYGGFVCWKNASISNYKSASVSLSIYVFDSESISRSLSASLEESSTDIEEPSPFPSTRESLRTN